MKRTDRLGLRSLASVNEAVTACRRCPRLVRFREGVEPKASFSEQRYWRKAVPGFGDPRARLVIIGIAPAAHGGNRTGRVFTGDGSGRFLVRALHAAGFANKPVSESLDDGLVYLDCYLTAAVKCAPPADKPTPREFRNCSVYMEAELSMLKDAKAVLVLGGLAFNAFRKYAKQSGAEVRGWHFRHGARYRSPSLPELFASYHPSPRNTNTGKLTQEMLVSVLLEITEGF